MLVHIIPWILDSFHQRILIFDVTGTIMSYVRLTSTMLDSVDIERISRKVKNLCRGASNCNIYKK